MIAICRTCKHWRPGATPRATERPVRPPEDEPVDQNAAGVCRRYPPVAMEEHDYFPLVHPEQVCGEHAMRGLDD